jgi:hypothetical protein
MDFGAISLQVVPDTYQINSRYGHTIHISTCATYLAFLSNPNCPEERPIKEKFNVVVDADDETRWCEQWVEHTKKR